MNKYYKEFSFYSSHFIQYEKIKQNEVSVFSTNCQNIYFQMNDAILSCIPRKTSIDFKDINIAPNATTFLQLSLPELIQKSTVTLQENVPYQRYTVHF